MKQPKFIPECWEELTPNQFEYLLSKIFVMMANEALTKDDVLHDFADYILGRKHFVNPVLKEEYMLMVYAAARIMSWIFLTNVDEVIVDYCSTQNLIPRIGKLVGPMSHGGDLKFGEYRTACEFYNAYTAKHDINDLNALVGILCRKPAKKIKRASFDGNYREPFSKYMIGKYAKRVRDVPEHVKWGVYLWFSYFCKHLITESFIIEGQEICFAPVFGSNADPDGKKDDSLGMLSVLFSLAESRTFGTINETDDARLLDVMTKLLNDYNQTQNLKKP